MPWTGHGIAPRFPPSRVKPVALFSDIVHTDEAGLASANFPVPSFAGQLRVMAVASAKSGFGSSGTPVLVRSPLLVQSSWPRFRSARRPIHCAADDFQ